MAPSYDAVALVSGGKDSVMAAMVASSYGHRVVALGNLLPNDVSVEELDSHCFQTVGHRAVGAYGELTGLPLFRRRITGASRHTELGYEVGEAAVEGDEVEDLRALLAAVVAAMPTVRAVTSGAILSDYQRLRVEAVCADLGLVSLAYLWRQPQGLMLEAMCDAGVDAVLIKVAAMGLKPKRDLGRTLAEMRPTLYEIERLYGSHCCGEGGEFETLTLDCPFFRRGRLNIAPEGMPAPEVVVTSPDPFAPSGHLAVAHSAVDLKPGAEATPAGETFEVTGPPPPPRRYKRDVDVGVAAAAAAAWASAAGVVVGQATVRETRGAALWTVAASVPGRSTTSDATSAAAAAAAASTEAALLAVERRLTGSGMGWSAVSMVHLYIADMSHFAAVNDAYVRVVPVSSPPARACVELPLPVGVPVALDVVVAVPPVVAAGTDADVSAGQLRSAPPRRSLHVQSLSCWAPACIGPYGQAVAHLGLAHLAGCIGMDPATLDLVSGDGAEWSATVADRVCARRSWRSAAAVARAMGCPLGRDTLAATVYAAAEAGEGARAASDEIFESLLAGDKWQDDVDIPGGAEAAAAGVPQGVRHHLEDLEPPAADGTDDGTDHNDGGGDQLDGEETGNPGRGVGRDGSGMGPAAPWPWSWRPLTTHVTVPRLPKGARVEVQPLVMDGDGPGGRGAGGEETSWDGDVEAARGAVVERTHAVAGAEGCCRSLSRHGRFCRAHAAVVRNAGVAEVEVVAAATAVAAALAAAGLSWCHVGSLRAYVAVSSRHVDPDVLANAAGALDAAVSAVSAGASAQCVVVPVQAACFDEVEDAGLVLELTAVTA